MPHQDQRLLDLSAWLDQQLPELFARCGWGEVPTAELTAASSDASFRRYFRWQGGDRSLIVMDAPPPREDCRPRQGGADAGRSRCACTAGAGC